MNKDKIISIIGLSGQSVFLNVDHFHQPEETIVATSMHTEPGGKGYNQAAAILALGGKINYLSVVGEDLYADDCINALRSENSSLHFKKIKNGKTAFATILTDKSSNNQVTVFRGVSNDISVEDVDDFSEMIINSKILLLTLELPLEVIERAIKIAKDNNVFVIMNPAPYNSDFNFFDMCDLITPNLNEAKMIYNIKDMEDFEEISNKIKAKNHKNVIITLGSKGCFVYTTNEQEIIPVVKVDAVDTTGAGDVFNAALAISICNNKHLKDSAIYANKVAAFSTTYKYVLKNISILNRFKY